MDVREGKARSGDLDIHYEDMGDEGDPFRGFHHISGSRGRTGLRFREAVNRPAPKALRAFGDHRPRIRPGAAPSQAGGGGGPMTRHIRRR